MSKAQDEISELMALQREAARKPPHGRNAGAKKQPAETETAAADEGAEVADEGAEAPAGEPDAAPEEGTTGPKSELERKMKELSEHIENAIDEIENAAKEQPVMVSLVAFTLGLVLGQSLSRR